MGEVFQFPQLGQRAHNAKVLANLAERKRLADWFRSLAMHIERDEIEHQPLAAMIVLSSAAGDEVLSIGYQQDGVTRQEVSRVQAASAAYRFVTTPFPRRGGNFFERKKERHDG